MWRQANCAFTCVNQSSGPAGQKDGSFRVAVTADMAGACATMEVELEP